MIDNTVRPVVVSNAVLLELIFCLAQRVQQLAPAPTPTPTPAAHLVGPMPTPSSAPGRKPAASPKPTRQA
jgi:hypothetical protein